jgi:hypothetical protein
MLGMNLAMRGSRLRDAIYAAFRKGAQIGPPKGKCCFCCRPYTETGPLSQGPMGDLICAACALQSVALIAEEVVRLESAEKAAQKQ